MFLAQAGFFLIVSFGFLMIYLTIRSNGEIDLSNMSPGEEEEDSQSLVPAIPEPKNNHCVPDDARHRKMSRKVSHANLMFNL